MPRASDQSQRLEILCYALCYQGLKNRSRLTFNIGVRISQSQFQLSSVSSDAKIADCLFRRLSGSLHHLRPIQSALRFHLRIILTNGRMRFLKFLDIESGGEGRYGNR